MFNVIHKSTHKKNQSQPPQTNSKHIKIAVTYLPGFNGFCNTTSKKIMLFHSVDQG